MENEDPFTTESPPPANTETGLEDDRDAEILSRLAIDDAEALREFVDRHQLFISRLIIRLVGWSEDHDDLLQEIFLSAWQGAKSFQRKSSVRTWLYQIAVRKCQNCQRSWRRQLRLIWQSAQMLLNGKNHPKTAKQAIDVQECQQAVRKGVEELREPLRTLVILRYFEELTPAEIATIFECNENLVRVRLHRARQELKQKLKGWEDEFGT
jgi:RNA polymerase sigma-70 factor (ECF subfamily)